MKKVNNLKNERKISLGKRISNGKFKMLSYSTPVPTLQFRGFWMQLPDVVDKFRITELHTKIASLRYKCRWCGCNDTNAFETLGNTRTYQIHCNKCDVYDTVSPNISFEQV